MVAIPRHCYWICSSITRTREYTRPSSGLVGHLQIRSPSQAHPGNGTLYFLHKFCFQFSYVANVVFGEVV